MLWHTLGAAGALESIATIQAMREGAIPPTINLEDPDLSTDGLDLTPGKATHRPIRAALNNSFGFGGQNAALIFRRWDG
jgi:3-oxoacyl-[acyl-carrier-protein] synthase II